MLIFVGTATISFTARRHASAVYAAVVSLSVCLSVRLSQVGVLLKRLNVRSRKQRHTIACGYVAPILTSWAQTAANALLSHAPATSRETVVFCCRRSRQNSNGVPNGGAKLKWGRLKLATFDKLERCNPWPHVANCHISISQLLLLWRHSHYDLAPTALAAPVLIMTSFSLWRHSLLSWLRPALRTNVLYVCYVRTPYRV